MGMVDDRLVALELDDSHVRYQTSVRAELIGQLTSLQRLCLRTINFEPAGRWGPSSTSPWRAGALRASCALADGDSDSSPR